MIKCILLDDEIPALRYLQTLLQQLPHVELVKTFNNPQKFLQEFDRLDFNTCILDIHMPGITGLEIAERMSGKAIIFSTAFKEFAADAFDLDAVDYLRKPYQLGRLSQAIEKAQHWLTKQEEESPDIVELNTAIGKAPIELDSIVYIDVADHDRRDKYIHRKEDTSILAKNISMDELLLLLPQGEFCRINRKTIVSLSKISAYTGQYVTILGHSDGSTLQFPLSPAYKNDFLKLISIRYNI